MKILCYYLLVVTLMVPFHNNKYIGNTYQVVVAFTVTSFNSSGSSSKKRARSSTSSSSSSLSALLPHNLHDKTNSEIQKLQITVSTIAASLIIGFGTLVGLPSNSQAENELAAKYGGSLDTSLVDQTCLVDKCSLQAKACLQDDPSCRKGLICTAKCLGDNTCITGCMARYGDENLDSLLKCTIEDNECIKVAILDGGADPYGQEPKPPAPTVQNFDYTSMTGSWYKVVGFNPNYDCYACQRNTFSIPSTSLKNSLQVDVEFSMPHLLPDGTPAPPKKEREKISLSNDESGTLMGGKSIGFNEYSTHETMVFDKESMMSPLDSLANTLTLGSSTDSTKKHYARTAHSEGEMFGLKFWENWYVIGENDPGESEFKFVYYNGKTRQNTYEGAFVYSRTKELSPSAMMKVYKIASDAGLNPDNFCKIQNGCFKELSPERSGSDYPFRGILASTRISQFLGVQPVSAENDIIKKVPNNNLRDGVKRAWYYEALDYLENPNRHFEAMDSQRVVMDWPEYVKNQSF